MKYTLILLGLYLGLSTASAGWRETGNAGNRVSQDFAATAREAFDILSGMNPPLATKETIQKLYEALSYTKIEEEISICDLNTLTGRWNCFDARNYPDENPKRIVVSKSSWQLMSRKERLGLALHEFLGILRVEQGTYQISGPFKDALSYNQENPNNPVEKILLAKLENNERGLSYDEARKFCAREADLNSSKYFYVFCEYDVKNINTKKIPSIPEYRFTGYRYMPDTGEYFYVFEAIHRRQLPRVLFFPVEESSEETSILASVRVVGIGPVGKLSYTVLVNSLKLARPIRFSDEMQAWAFCYQSLSERKGTNPWKFDQAECEVARENPSDSVSAFYYVIQTQNPFVKE